MTLTDVANLALDFLGKPPINDYLNGNTDDAKRLRRQYPVAARSVLLAEETEWGEAIDYATMETEYTVSYDSHGSHNALGVLTFETTATIDASVPQKGELEITIGATTYTHPYTSWTSSTFTLTTGLEATMDGDDSATTTPNNHNTEYEYMYQQASNVLRVVNIENDPDLEFISENGYLFTNEFDANYGIRIRYIKDIRDEVSNAVVYGAHIAYAIAAELAYRLAPRKNPNLIQLARAEAETALVEAMAEDAETRRATHEEQGSTRWDEVK